MRTSDQNDEVVMTWGQRMLANVVGFGTLAILLPGAFWLFQGWGIESRVAALLSVLMALMTTLGITWTCGLAFHRYVRWKRPAWVTHPGTRLILGALFGLQVTACPIAFYESELNPLLMLVLPPLGGAAMATLVAIVQLVVLFRSGKKV